VAIATNVSKLEARNVSDVRAGKRSIATETMNKLLVRLSPKRMISMEMMRHKPPVIAIMKCAGSSMSGKSQYVC
jgi:predicted transcriptional regulator